MAKTVGVVGGGIMGSGIAEVSARAGYDVLVHEIHDEAAEAASYNQKPGEIKVVDQNGDGAISLTDDRVILGNSYPDWIGSLSNRITYGNVDFSVLATARLGYMFNDAFAGANNVLAGRYNNILVDYWTPENPTNAFPSPNRDSEGAVDAVAVQFFDGSHWRVRNITLGYTVPESLTSRIGNSTSLRIYGQLQDPWVFSDFPGVDPEGAEGNVTPSYRSFILGASVGF